MLPRPLDTTIAHKMINLMPELSGTDKRVAATIIDHFNRKTAQCDPGLDRIAWLVGVTRRQVIWSVSNIEQTGILRKVRHGGHSQRNSYEPAWSRFRELEAEWKVRFSGKSRGAARAKMSPTTCQPSHLCGDKPVTQTFLINPSKEPSSIRLVSEESKNANKPTSWKGHSGKEIGQSTGAFRGSAPFERTSSRDAARAAAERRWSADLNDRYAASPTVYGDVISAIDPAMQAAATEAEMHKPGAGLLYILNQLQAQKTQPLTAVCNVADVSGPQQTPDHKGIG